MMNNMKTDEQLFVHFIDCEDQAAFSELVSRHRPRLIEKLAAKFDYDTAEEIFQLAIIKVYQSREKYDRARPFFPWLHTIVYCVSIDVARQRTSRCYQPSLSSIFKDREQSFDLEGSTPPPDEQLIHDESVDQALSLYEELPDNQRQAIKLTILEGLTHREAGKHINRDHKQITRRLHAGLKTLQSRMSAGEVGASFRGRSPQAKPVVVKVA